MIGLKNNPYKENKVLDSTSNKRYFRSGKIYKLNRYLDIFQAVWEKASKLRRYVNV